VGESVERMEFISAFARGRKVVPRGEVVRQLDRLAWFDYCKVFAFGSERRRPFHHDAMEIWPDRAINFGNTKHVGRPVWGEHRLRVIQEPERLIARIVKRGSEFEVAQPIHRTRAGNSH